MADISISIDATAVQHMLDRAPNQVNQAMRGGAEDSSTYLLAIVRRYPPQRPGSSYRRTNTLNRSWSRRVTGSGLRVEARIGSAGSMAPHNRYVMSRRHQARIHQGRWRTLETVVETERDRVVRFYADRLAMIGQR